ncbi:MAG: ABC transporter ATP-binding protein [Pseudomonadota bacterium]
MTAVLEIKRLDAFYGDSHVVHGADLKVEEGEVATLLGRNGAGKTTMLRAITGVLNKRRGSIRIRGSETINLPPHHVARLGVGYVPEERGIFASLTVEENLLLPPKIAEGGMTLPELYALFPNLEERRTSYGTKLSGGEQQMLAIARILRTGSRLILLDEPTEGLAPVIIEQIAAAVAKLKALGFTVLLVEQNLRFVRSVADRHYLVEDGQVIDAIPESDIDARMEEVQACLGV